MNPQTGELRMLSPAEEQSIRAMLGPMAHKGLEPLPRHLQEAARTELAGRTRTTVRLDQPGPLQSWAAQRRADRDRKARRKAARAARRRG